MEGQVINKGRDEHFDEYFFQSRAEGNVEGHGLVGEEVCFHLLVHVGRRGPRRTHAEASRCNDEKSDLWSVTRVQF